MSHSQPFFELCKDIEIAIRGHKIRHPIFVIKVGDYDLLLDQPFLNSMKFSQEYKPDKIFDTITYLYIHQIDIFRTLASQDLANQKKN